MNNPFSQPKLIYKLCFTSKYRDIEVFEKFFSQDILGISTYEVESSTIDSYPDDLWIIEVLTEEKPEIKFLVDKLETYAKTHGLYLDPNITLQQIEDKDWVAEYQKQLQPIEIGKFFITSSAATKKCPKNKIPIYIEASRAFGTGDHATTSLCIEAMNFFQNQPMNTIFDIGTGSGILSFAAEKIWPSAKILGCDIEEVSINIAKENGICNSSNVYFYQNSEEGLNIPKKWDKKFDLIVSNILAAPLILMAHTIRLLCHDNTILILSGFLDYQLPDIAKAYKESGFIVLNNLEKDRWITLTLKVNIN